MEQNKFKIGDKVRVVEGYIDMYGRYLSNKVGKIVYIDDSNVPYLIDFGKGFDGHDGGGLCRNLPKTCWWFCGKEFALVKNEPKIIQKDRLTIIVWGNGDRTVVKCAPTDTYNKYLGIAIATMKYQLGNKVEHGRQAYEIIVGQEKPVVREFKVGDIVKSKYGISYGRVGVVINDKYQGSLCVDFGEDLRSGWYISSHHLELLKGKGGR